MVAANSSRLRSIIISDPIAFLGWEYATDCAKGINRVSDQYRDPFHFAYSQAPLDCVLGQQFKSMSQTQAKAESQHSHQKENNNVTNPDRFVRMAACPGYCHLHRPLPVALPDLSSGP